MPAIPPDVREDFEMVQCEAETLDEHLYNCAQMMGPGWAMASSEPNLSNFCRDTLGRPLSDLLARLADQGRRLDWRQVALMAWLGGSRSSGRSLPGLLEQFTHDEIDAMAWLLTVRFRRTILPGILEGLPSVTTPLHPPLILPPNSATHDPSGTPWTERVVKGFVPHSCREKQCEYDNGSFPCDEIGARVDQVCASETTAEHQFNRRQLSVWFDEWYVSNWESLAARGCERVLGVPLSRLLSVLADKGMCLRERDFLRLAHVGGPPPHDWSQRVAVFLPREHERLVEVMARLIHQRLRDVVG